MKYENNNVKVRELMSVWFSMMILFIPDFQRQFVWSANKIVHLLNNIIKGVFIGNVTLQMLPSESKMILSNLEGEELNGLDYPSDHSKTYVVIDGLQRLTVFYSLLSGKNIGMMKSVYYDLDRNEFVTKNSSNCIKATDLFSEERSIPAKARVVLEKLLDYNLTMIVYSEIKISEGIELFNDINQSGVRLNQDNIFAAMTRTDDFNFYREAKRIRKSVASLGYGDIKNSTLIQMLMLLQYDTASKESKKKFYDEPEKLVGLFDKLQPNLVKAIDFLNRNCGVERLNEIPYEFQLILLVYYCWKSKKQTPKQVKILKAWIYKSAFGERYQGASTNKWNQDVSAMKQLVEVENESLLNINCPLSIDGLIRTKYGKNSARTKAFLLVLKTLNPRSIVDGSPILSSMKNTKVSCITHQHIFAKKYLDEVLKPVNKESLMNITWLLGAENSSLGSVSPAIYLDKSRKVLKEDFDMVMESLMLNIDDFSKFTYEKYDEFLYERAVLAQKAIMKLIEI